MEGAFLNEGFYSFTQFKRNVVLAENGKSLKHTSACTETAKFITPLALRVHLTDLA